MLHSQQLIVTWFYFFSTVQLWSLLYNTVLSDYNSQRERNMYFFLFLYRK